MRVESGVPFDEVRQAFLRENDIQLGRNSWALGAIRIADVQFGHWVRATLSLNDILNTMLPHHDHGVELVPPSCSSVSEAIERLKYLPPHGLCRRRIDELSTQSSSPIFLSMAPIHSPDYRALVDRGYQGLTHIDGLHRLIAWGRSGTSGIMAYVAGAASEFNTSVSFLQS